MTGVVVDASAIAAISFGEPGFERFAELIGDADPAVMSAATFLEASLVVEAREGPAGIGMIEGVVREGRIEIVDVTEDDARAAVSAWRRFGKGNHAAGLNFGDCFVYALAESTGYPIVCDGNDFAQTGVEVLPRR